MQQQTLDQPRLSHSSATTTLPGLTPDWPMQQAASDPQPRSMLCTQPWLRLAPPSTGCIISTQPSYHTHLIADASREPAQGVSAFTTFTFNLIGAAHLGAFNPLYHHHHWEYGHLISGFFFVFPIRFGATTSISSVTTFRHIWELLEGIDSTVQL